jgi:hypothetical protein
VEPFASRSTAPTDVWQNTKQREIVRTEGEERHGVDGLVRH